MRLVKLLSDESIFHCWTNPTRPARVAAGVLLCIATVRKGHAYATGGLKRKAELT